MTVVVSATSKPELSKKRFVQRTVKGSSARKVANGRAHSRLEDELQEQ